MLTIEARSAQLLPEQHLCYEEFRTDIRDVFADPAAAALASETLRDALSSATPQAWALAVNTIAGFLAAPAADACAGARRRLAAFVAENADLLGSVA